MSVFRFFFKYRSMNVPLSPDVLFVTGNTLLREYLGFEKEKKKKERKKNRGPLSTQPWASCRGKRTLSIGIFHCFQIVRTRELFPFPRSWHPGPATLVWGHAHTINSFKSRPSPKPKTRSCRGKRARPCDPGGIFVRRTFDRLFDPKVRSSSRSLFSPSSSLPPLLWIGASGPEKFPLSDPAFL